MCADTRCSGAAGPWVYFRGQGPGALLPKAEVRVSPDDRGFVFGDGVYEFVRSYGGRLFRLKEHLARLHHSLDAVRIRYEGLEKLGQVCQELLTRNRLEQGDAAVYIQVTRGAFQRTRLFPPDSVEPTAYIEVNRLDFQQEAAEHGVVCITTPDIRWARCDIKSICLLPTVLASQQAHESGAAEAILVRDRVVTEGTHTNVFGVKAGEVLTHPTGNRILAGITRGVVLELCAQLGVPVKETGIQASELTELDELFLASTSAEVTPVVRVDSRRIGSGGPGPLTRRLQAAFRDYVRRALAGAE